MKSMVQTPASTVPPALPRPTTGVCPSVEALKSHPGLQGVSIFCTTKINRLLAKLAHREHATPVCIGLTGGSGSGKSQVAQMLQRTLSPWLPVAILSQDNYYRNFEADFAHIPLKSFYHQVDLDHPNHICFDQLAADLQAIQSHPVQTTFALQKLIYGTPHRKPYIASGQNQFVSAPIVITEGIFALYDDAVCQRYDLTVYVDADETVRRERWLSRNRQDNRGTTDHMWDTSVACLQQHILPRQTIADIVLNNTLSVDDMEAFLALIGQYVKKAVAN